MKAQGLHRGAHLIGDEQGLLDFRPAQQHDELLAADTRDEIIAAHRRHETRGHALQDPVAGTVAVAVIDDLEVVQIPQQHDKGQVGARLLGDFLRETLFERFAIGDSGQRIDSRALLFAVQS